MSQDEGDRLVTVYTVNDSGTAEIIRNALESEGIFCVLDGASQAGFAGVFRIGLMVRARDADRAGQILRQEEKPEEMQ